MPRTYFPQAIRFVGGFAMAGDITPEEYLSTKPDPIAAFADPIMVSSQQHRALLLLHQQHYEVLQVRLT